MQITIQQGKKIIFPAILSTLSPDPGLNSADSAIRSGTFVEQRLGTPLLKYFCHTHDIVCPDFNPVKESFFNPLLPIFQSAISGSFCLLQTNPFNRVLTAHQKIGCKNLDLRKYLQVQFLHLPIMPPMIQIFCDHWNDLQKCMESVICRFKIIFILKFGQK